MPFLLHLNKINQKKSLIKRIQAKTVSIKLIKNRKTKEEKSNWIMVNNMNFCLTIITYINNKM